MLTEKIDWTTENYGEGVAAEALEETLSPNRQCVVYAKITNYAERVSYLSSDGFILDNIAPEVTVTVLNPGDAENGIFNEDVRLRIDVTDPKAGETCAGLREVWYEITAAGNVNESGQGNWPPERGRNLQSGDYRGRGTPITATMSG